MTDQETNFFEKPKQVVFRCLLLLSLRSSSNPIATVVDYKLSIPTLQWQTAEIMASPKETKNATTFEEKEFDVSIDLMLWVLCCPLTCGAPPYKSTLHLGTEG